jgi:hypothetical protein
MAENVRTFTITAQMPPASPWSGAFEQLPDDIEVKGRLAQVLTVVLEEAVSRPEHWKEASNA